jgi:O-antigen ligase
LFGVGTGDANDILLQSYKSKDYAGILENRLNAHNQYLQTYIAVGIPGFLVLILMLFIPLIQSFRTGNILFLLLLVLVSFNLLFESMFERQAGVVFYAFFNGLFFCTMYMEKREI